MKRLFLLVFLASVILAALQSSRSEANPTISVENNQAVLELGSKVYRVHCMACHGKDGKSPIKEMNIADGEWKHGETVEDHEKIIRKGVQGTAMLPFEGKLSDEEITAVVKYVMSLVESKEKQ